MVHQKLRWIIKVKYFDFECALKRTFLWHTIIDIKHASITDSTKHVHNRNIPIDFDNQHLNFGLSYKNRVKKYITELSSMSNSLNIKRNDMIRIKIACFSFSKKNNEPTLQNCPVNVQSVWQSLFGKNNWTLRHFTS